MDFIKWTVSCIFGTLFIMEILCKYQHGIIKSNVAKFVGKTFYVQKCT